MRKIFIVVIFTTLSVIGYSSMGLALEGEKTAVIIGRCNEIKKNIKKLQVADANTRVALGREYENILTKLMTNMNSRLAQNHSSAGNLLETAAGFSNKLDLFRELYRNYDQKIETLLTINCEKDPAEFYETLEESRTKRSQVQAAHVELISIAEAYDAELMTIWGAK
ncbi:MAG: hypothetical protein LBQ02_00450 [Candidatus Nomurabacteria bacterium]|jgi:aminoglycoside N3'-acetyltransferase|nr:hypothetical protein [Candidatus Nomurabacteria bacterium]